MLETLSDGEAYPWRAHLEFAMATARAGNIEQAAVIKRSILDQLLEGGIETRQLPYVANAMLQ